MIAKLTLAALHIEGALVLNLRWDITDCWLILQVQLEVLMKCGLSIVLRAIAVVNFGDLVKSAIPHYLASR